MGINSKRYIKIIFRKSKFQIIRYS